MASPQCNPTAILHIDSNISTHCKKFRYLLLLHISMGSYSTAYLMIIKCNGLLHFAYQLINFRSETWERFILNLELKIRNRKMN